MGRISTKDSKFGSVSQPNLKSVGIKVMPCNISTQIIKDTICDKYTFFPSSFG